MLLDPSALDADEIEAWRDLSEHALEDNVFFAPEMVLPAVAILTAAEVRLAVVRDGSRWLAAMPVERRQVAGPISVPAYVGWQHAYSYLGIPLVRDDTPQAVASLVEGMLGQRGTACLFFRRARLDGPVFDLVVAAVAELGGTWQIMHPYARPELSVEDTLKLSGKRASEMRRLKRRMEEQVGPVTYHEGLDEESLEAFLALEDSGWKGRRGSSMRSAGAEEWFRRLVHNLEPRGALRLRVMRAGGQPVAAVCDVVGAQTRFGFKISFDESLARFSPGALLLVEDSLAFMQSPGAVRTWDSCISADRSVTTAIWPRRRPIGTLLATAPGPVGATIANAVPAALKARGVIRRSLKRTTRP